MYHGFVISNFIPQNTTLVNFVYIRLVFLHLITNHHSKCFSPMVIVISWISSTIKYYKYIPYTCIITFIRIRLRLESNNDICRFIWWGISTKSPWKPFWFWNCNEMIVPHSVSNWNGRFWFNCFLRLKPEENMCHKAW